MLVYSLIKITGVSEFKLKKLLFIVSQDFENMTLRAVQDTMTILDFPVPEASFFLIVNQTSGFVSTSHLSMLCRLKGC